ncbi:MAG: TonB-dependent receptor, partial [Mariniphaga sp.]|nr:TonB-dependent receptor [Mariniphaga sp.]
MKFAFWKVIYIGILLIFTFQSTAQDIEEIKITGQFNNRPVTEFIEFLETQHNLKIFYKKSWITDLEINQQFNNAPLYQALTRTFRGTNLNFDFFQDNAIIITPKSADSRLQDINNEELLTVLGDPLNIGRYRSATISGRIVDGKNGEPLTGAVLYISKLEKGTSTNSNGNFEIELPTGEHNLQLSFMGYEQNNRRIRLIESGQIELELFEESHSIEEVTVTGEGQNTSRTQMSMVRVDAKILKELPGLMGEADVIKSITMMAGVQTVSELASGFNVRGGNTDQNLVLVNGTPVFNSSHLFGFFSMLNPDVIENIILYKGGMPAKFGERVSSVMEVDLKEGNDEVIAIYGGLGLLNSRLTVEGPLTKNKKLKILAGGRTSYSDWILKKIPDVELTQSVTKFYDISGKATYNFNLHNKLSLMAYSSNDEFNTSSQTIIKYGNLLANLMLRNRLTENLNGELNLSYSRYKSRLTDLADEKQYESYFLDNQLQYYSGKYHFNWHPHERHNINFGGNLIRYSTNPGEVLPANKETLIKHRVIESENAFELAGYLSDELLLLPNLILNVGLRYSHFLNLGEKTIFKYDESIPKSPESIIDSTVFGKNEVAQSYGGIEPRVAFNYIFNNGYSLKMSFQRTQQFINQVSNNAVISPAETWKMSDFHLKPLISDQIAIGVSNNNNEYGLQFTTEVYYKKLKNLIEYKNGAEIIMNQHLETDLIPSDGYSYGIEFTANKANSRLTGMINYMYSRTMRKTDGYFDEEKINSGSWYPSIYDKPHDLSVTATYHISRRWRLSGNFVFISGRPLTLPEIKYRYAGQTLIYYSDRNKYRMPPYHRFDVSITIDENLKRKRSWKGSWTLSVYNFYGRHNPYSVYYRKGSPNAANNYTR